MEFTELLIKIAAILEKLGIDYCITGGFAVSLWGRPRSTFDIDLVVRLRIEDIAPLARHLRRLSRAGYLEESTAKEAAVKGGEFNFIHAESGIKVDFWVIKKGDAVGMAELKRKVSKALNGKKIFFISAEDLILSKLRWYKESESTRHLEDIGSILRISKVDLNYIKEQAEGQSTSAIFNKLLK